MAQGQKVAGRRWPARLLAVPLGLAALALFMGGCWLLWLGGSAYYLLAGLACAASSVGLWRGRPFAGLLFALFLVATLLWSIAEAGLAPWPLVARLAGPAVVGLAVALVARGGRIAAAAASGACLALMLAAFLLPHPESLAAPRSDAAAAGPIAASADWLHYGNDAGGSRYSPLGEITPANVGTLKQAWTYHVGPGPAGTLASFQATPLMADGLITFCTGYNDVIALDAATGKERWRHRAQIDPRGVIVTTCRGVARHADPDASGPCARRILTATVDARLIALDALTGARCPGFGRDGAVDLLEGMGQVDRSYYYVTSAPAIVRGKVVLGGWITDSQYVGEPSGVIRAFDAVTGQLAWAWDMGRPDRRDLPPPGEHYTRGTPNSWAPISADEALGLVYLPTGNATPDYYGMHRTAADERYASAVVALDAQTGVPRWHFQTTHHDIWDYDVASQPTLFDLRTPQGIVPALAQATKRGELFLLDRRTGKPLAAVAERAVPTMAAPGERPAPTQPFSIGMPSFAGPPLTEGSMWGLTPLDQLWCRIRFRQSHYAGSMTPVGLKRTIIYPGYLGGMDWGSVTIDPARQLLFVNSNRLATVDRLIPRAAANARGLKRSKAGVIADTAGALPMEGTPYAVEVDPFLSPIGVPCQQPPYGMLSAIDLRTRTLLWSHPFGTAAGSGPMRSRIGVPLPMGVPNMGGSLATASGLLFIGASQDGRMRAIDARSGVELWHATLPAGGNATPMTFRQPGGKQYVVIAAGGHLGLGNHMSDTLVAYALP